jgi:uncharacterized SAM-binding protein YcdF (DUF218 family)
MNTAIRRRTWIFILIVLAGVVLWARNAGKILVVDAPEPSDVIVVLAGETDRRPAHALELLHQGLAARVIIDVPAQAKVYDTMQVELAERYVQRLPNAASISICPIWGLSTRAEAHDVANCLANQPTQRVLIVTSDFHTHRSLSIFRHEVRGKTFSIGAAHDPAQFGTRWWTHRQWAKTFFDEWIRLFWWSAVERWHR